MKVIQVIPNLNMGGAEIMCETLTIELMQNGIDVSVISLFNHRTPITERLIKKGVKIDFLDKKPGLDLSIIRKLKTIFKREKPDVVHTHLHAQKYAIIAAKQAKIPVKIHTVHSVADKELSRVDKILAKRFYKKQNVIPIALSPLIQDTIVKQYNIEKKNVRIILNGVNISKCKPKIDYAIQDTIKIIHIGRFVEAKNHKGLIEAFYLFHKNYPKSILQLIGEGELRIKIEKQVETLRLVGAVEFLGLQEEVYTYLHNADIFALTSHYEGTPMALIEAMGTGLPIVATQVGGVPDMIKSGENGVLTSSSPEDINRGLEFFIENLEKRKYFGVKAREDADAFSSTTMAKKYIDVYQRTFQTSN